MAALPPVLTRKWRPAEVAAAETSFPAALAAHRLPPLRREHVRTVQVNVGKLCNQACLHCHVEAGPKRTEQMSEEVAERILWLLARTPGAETLDITGGAPELNAHFRRLVLFARGRGLRVIDRCNLTVLFEPGQQDLGRFLADNQVDITASLPCYTEGNVDRQRGRGAFEKSIRGLQQLNALGYGLHGSGLELNLVYNPLGPSLPPPQAQLEADYKRELWQSYSIEFNQLFTLTNMPIKRFAEALTRAGESERYAELLRESFNPATIAGLMCRDHISVGWDGELYDCDFNQMLELPLSARRTLWQIESFNDVLGSVALAGHCFGCTAGAGSSCTGSLA